MPPPDKPIVDEGLPPGLKAILDLERELSGKDAKSFQRTYGGFISTVSSVVIVACIYNWSAHVLAVGAILSVLILQQAFERTNRYRLELVLQILREMPFRASDSTHTNQSKK